METIKNSTKLMFCSSITTLILISSLFSTNLYSQDKSIIIITEKADQYEDIQYQSIEASQIINFSKLVRVYINRSSHVLIGDSPVALDNAGEAVKKILVDNIENKYGNLTPKSIVNAKLDLKLLVRKSVFTSKSDFKALMQFVNNTIWGLQKYYSNKVYGEEYPSLTQEQKDNINKLVPLHNYLAKDNEY